MPVREKPIMKTHPVDVAIVGCGSIGLATAFYLSRQQGVGKIALIDSGPPMAFTSAQSGENYRNWWPHPSMVDFTNRSIDLMEALARESDNRFNMTRRGYALATRSENIETLIGQLEVGLGADAEHLLRYHDSATGSAYQPALQADWQAAPIGVDILRAPALIQQYFPAYAHDIRHVIHIRRGGDISSQQLGMLMLEELKAGGAQRVAGEVVDIDARDGFRITVKGGQGGEQQWQASRLVNAAGPFAAEIAAMLGESLPVFSTFQQKIAFEDREAVVPRNMPFTIDLDEQMIDWSAEERALLSAEPDMAWMAETFPGAIHCRPDGGDTGRWIRLGWAWNSQQETPMRDRALDDHFPELVLRGASRLNPALKAYQDHLPRDMHHYGGWYTMTEENWPLIGPMATEGAFMNCAFSGFGSMSACAAGELCAAWLVGAPLPHYAEDFSLQRYDRSELMQTLLAGNRGIL